MIVVNNGLYRQVLFANKVNSRDYFVACIYGNYKGRKIPCFFKKHKSLTSKIDLSKTEEELLAQMKSNYRNEVRKAEPQGISFTISTDVEKFVRDYNDFAEQREGLSKININSVNKYPDIIITNAEYQGNCIVSHVTYVDRDEKTAVLLYSTSVRLNTEIDKKIVGYANKYLHYKDFCYLKSNGYLVYDFAGVTLDPNDTERYGIGLFKKGFGGELVEELTLYSPIMYLLMKIKGRK